MAAPDLTQREVCFVQKIGTDDAGANAVGAPQPRLTIAAALADLAANYPPATSTFFHIVAVGPGTFTEAGISLPPWTFIEGTCDGESQPTSIILLTGDINLSSGWTANATVRGGLSNLSIRAASGTPALDFTMPVPVAGNPLRTVELHNVHHNLVSEIFEATSTADNLVKEFCRQFGVNTDTFRQTGGTSRFNNVWSAALVTIIDKASFATVGTWDGLIVSATGSSLTASSIAAAGTTLRLTNSAVRSLILAQPAPGVLAVSADGPSIPVRTSVSYTGLASTSNLTRISDAGGVGYSPTTPANWPTPTPTTVQEALDYQAGGSTTGTFVQIVRTGNRSSAAWGTAGCAINDTANTFTDSTSAGAVAGVTAARTFGVPTFASAGGVTYAIAANIYIAGAPVITGGTATATYALYSAGGDIFSGGSIRAAGYSSGADPVANVKFFAYGGANNEIIRAASGVDAAISIILDQTTRLLRFVDGSGPTTRMTLVMGSGNLLLGGTTNGTGNLQLLSNSGTTASGLTFFTDVNFYRSGAGKLVFNSTNTTPTLEWQENGTASLRVYTSSLTAVLEAQNGAMLLRSGAGITAITLSTAQLVRFNAYGAGSITSDASGNLTAVSDGRKKNVLGAYTRGLEEICALQPKRFKWRKDSGLSTKEINAGFIAQDVIEHFPEAIGRGPDGFYTFHDRPITAGLVNAVKELAARLEKIEAAGN